MSGQTVPMTRICKECTQPNQSERMQKSKSIEQLFASIMIRYEAAQIAIVSKRFVTVLSNHIMT